MIRLRARIEIYQATIDLKRLATIDRKRFLLEA